MKKIVYLLTLLTLLYAKPLEVKQLFNKKITTVKKETISIKHNFYATTKIDDSNVYDITLRFSGYIEKLHADKNYKKIKRDEKLFEIYSDKIANIYEELKLAKRYNQKASIEALYKKLALINAPTSISRDYTVSIKSPVNGYIIDKQINQGSFLSKGKVAFKIVNLENIWVIAKVYQKDLSKIRVGQKAKVEIEGIGKFKSKVDYIYPNMDSKTKTVDVRLVIDNKDLKIYPNLFATVNIEVESSSMLTLPKSSILTKGKKHYVFLPLKNGSFEPKEIKAVRIDAKKYRIDSGLKEGDKVIDNALFLLDSDAITNGLYDNDNEDW